MIHQGIVETGAPNLGNKDSLAGSSLSGRSTIETKRLSVSSFLIIILGGKIDGTFATSAVSTCWLDFCLLVAGSAIDKVSDDIL